MTTLKGLRYMNTKKEKRIYYEPSDMALRSSALCFSMKFKGDVATSEFLRYNVISRRGDIIELYIEEKDMYVHLSLADFLRCIKNYENDK